VTTVAPASVSFLGAAGTVTGSKHVIATGQRKVLLDCGLFQGLKQLRERNWQPPPVDTATLDAVVLSHAHIDHSGYLPALVRHGYDGPVYCTPATADLLAVLLPDSAYLQEEQAAHATHHRYSRHEPPLPLYTMADAHAALRLLEPRPYHEPFAVAEGIQATYRYAGHILGSASVTVDLDTGRDLTLAFSGDLGRWDRPILHDPEPIPAADILLVESTYGNRHHPDNPAEALARIVRQTADRGGALIVPAFAVGRTQELLWLLRTLEESGDIPILPVYTDSPMAIRVTDIYRTRTEEHDLEMVQLIDDGASPLYTTQFQFARTPEESKRLNHVRGPVIIISASGMATGGRILHHLHQRLSDQRTTVLLVGYQAAGTRGRALQDGAAHLRMFGQSVAVRARIETLDGLSAHADQSEILRWLGAFERPPASTYLVHGEPAAADALADAIRTRLRWDVQPARDRARVPIERG